MSGPFAEVNREFHIPNSERSSYVATQSWMWDETEALLHCCMTYHMAGQRLYDLMWSHSRIVHYTVTGLLYQYQYTIHNMITVMITYYYITITLASYKSHIQF